MSRASDSSSLNRRQFLGNVGVGAAAAALAGNAALSADAAPSRPNILLVHCHDLGQFLHCYGVKTVQTPNLDAFAAKGVRFARSYCPNPGCSPSRAAMFTGRYPHSNGVMGLTHGNFAWDLNPDEKHLAQVLRDNGYTSRAIGVIHETRSGFQRCGYESHDRNAMAEKATDNAIAELKKLAGGDKPFFLCVGFVEPHRLPYPLGPDGIPREHGFPGPHLEPDDSLGVDVPPWLKDTPGTRQELAGLQGAVKHVDAQFGRLMKALEDLGRDKDTLVLFTTDHGIAMPRAKCSVYEPGLQVALLLRYPARNGWSSGAVHNCLVSNIDVMPTLLELPGIPIPSNIQGRSLAPLLDGRAYTPRAAVFGELTYHDFYDPRRTIRTETHKLIANFSTAHSFMDPSQQWRPRSLTVTPDNPADAYHPHLEIFDLVNDPWEQTNLAGKPKYAKVQSELVRQLHQHMVETNDPLLQGAVTSPQHITTLKMLTG